MPAAAPPMPPETTTSIERKRPALSRPGGNRFSLRIPRNGPGAGSKY